MYNKYNMEKEIKKITINFSYSNWGYFEDLYRDFIVFTKDNVLFIRMPLDQSLFSDKRKIKCYDMDLILMNLVFQRAIMIKILDFYLD